MTAKKRKYCIIGGMLITLSIGIAWLYFSETPTLLENVSFSKAVYDEHHQLLRLTLSADDKYRLYTPLKEIDPALIEASLLQEDQYFHWHYGINPFALIKAIWQTYVIKSRRMGASTISMQLARMRYGMNSKRITGKLWQIVRAVQIEMHYSKEAILEAYFNLAPYGGNVEGIGAASLIYFHVPANKLNLAEAFTLSLLPQNPEKRVKANRTQAQAQELKRLRDKLLERWLLHHPEDNEKKSLFGLPLTMYSIRQLPFLAPHFVNSVLDEPFQANSNLQTTLDYRLQRIFERITTHYLSRKKVLGVYNGAVLLVDTRDMGIKVLLGSANFFNKAISGQVNGTESKRSPGSTLKPFIYGLALDQGLIHPNTVLKDVPRSFNGYNPENFDYDFMGPVKAKDALVLSRNIPAIGLSSQLANPSLHQFLARAQISRLKSESYYGLSLNLGAAELTMQELTGLYAMLVNGGIWHPLRKENNKKDLQAIRLLSPEASFLVLDMLKNTPGNPFNERQTSTALAYKTGTSSGYRDAWAVGTFGPYVLSVWIGNFDNKANQIFIGKEIAAPLLFELVEAVRQISGSLPSIATLPQSLHLAQIDVCKASGMLPTRYCTDTEKTWFIPGKSPIKRDNLYREVAINTRNGLRTCHIDEYTRFEVFEFWPSDMLKIFKKAGIQRHTPPFWESDCALTGNGGINPQITSPQNGLQYVVKIHGKAPEKVPFTAVTDAGIAHLYWFVNERYLEKTTPDKPLFWRAKPGKYVVRVVDDHGLSDARDIEVVMDG